MLIPIGDENVKQGYTPYISRFLIIVNVAVFIYQFTLSNEASVSSFILHYGTIPLEISNGVDWFTLLTCMFLHGGIMHLLGNMLFLWIFGDNIEAAVGNLNFLLFYLIGGIVASLVHVAFAMHSNVPVVGASGAIAACLGAYMVMFPQFKVKVFAFIFVFRIAAVIFMLLWIVQQLIAGIGAFNLPTADTKQGSVAYWAHIGGFVFGVIAGFYLKRKYKLQQITLNSN
jgi:membrane associated rhomboid family serine protease